MTDEDLTAIRARHEDDCKEIEDMNGPERETHTDRAALLAEVERLRARVEELEQVRETALDASADWALSLRVDPQDGIEYVELNSSLNRSMSDLCWMAWDATPVMSARKPKSSQENKFIRRADEIWRLREENAKLRAALQDIARQPEPDEESAQAVARAVLRGRGG